MLFWVVLVFCYQRSHQATFLFCLLFAFLYLFSNAERFHFVPIKGQGRCPILVKVTLVLMRRCKTSDKRQGNILITCNIVSTGHTISTVQSFSLHFSVPTGSAFFGKSAPKTDLFWGWQYFSILSGTKCRKNIARLSVVLIKIFEPCEVTSMLNRKAMLCLLNPSLSSFCTSFHISFRIPW